MPDKIIDTLRRAKDWTIRDLSNESGVSITDLSNYRRGREDLTPEQLFAVANALDTTIAELLDNDFYRKKFVTDTCHYCGRMYHPMPVWSRGDTCVYVCNDLVWGSLDEETTDCISLANTDGFSHRQDLSYKR